MGRWTLGIRKDNTESRGEHGPAARTLISQPTALTKNKEAIGDLLKISQPRSRRSKIPCGISRLQKVEVTDPLLLWSPGRRRLPFKRCSNLFCRRKYEGGRRYRVKKNTQNRGSRCNSADGEDWEKGKRTWRVDHLLLWIADRRPRTSQRCWKFICRRVIERGRSCEMEKMNRIRVLALLQCRLGEGRGWIESPFAGFFKKPGIDRIIEICFATRATHGLQNWKLVVKPNPFLQWHQTTVIGKMQNFFAFCKVLQPTKQAQS